MQIKPSLKCCLSGACAFSLLATLSVAAHAQEDDFRGRITTLISAKGTVVSYEDVSALGLTRNNGRSLESQSMGEYLDDSMITVSVKSQFLATEGLDSLPIRVRTNQGVVWLTGEVKNASQYAQAELVVSEIEGVRRIINDLHISP